MSISNIKYSVIIPTYNEENYIASLLEEIENQREELPYEIEIIIADGKSNDHTIDICRHFNTKIVSSSKGRGKQLKKGADIAIGNIFIFLHADLNIPREMFLFIDETFIPDKDIAVFRTRYDENGFLFKTYSFFTRFDTIFSTFGDQGLVLASKKYYEIGGFKDMPMMEDVEFFRKARKYAPIKKLKKHITASTRKFGERGVIKTQLISFLLIIKYLAGVDTKKIYNQYYNEKKNEEKGGNYICKIS